MPEYRTIHSFGEDIVTSLPEHIDSKDICLCYTCVRFNRNPRLNCPIAQENYRMAKKYNLRVPVVACSYFKSEDELLNDSDSEHNNYDEYDEDDGYFVIF